MLLEVGCAEPWKAGYHRVLQWLLAGAAIYNGGAFVYRGVVKGAWQPHLAVNAVVDTALVFWERGHVRSHTASR